MTRIVLKFLGLIIVSVTLLFLAFMIVMYFSGKFENDMVHFGISQLLMTILYCLPPLCIGMLFIKYNEVAK